MSLFDRALTEGKDPWKISTAIADAKKLWGTGWARLSQDQRRGAVAERAIALIAAQEDDVAAKIGAKFHAMANALIQKKF